MVDQTGMSAYVEPERSRPSMPADYGVPTDDATLLPWSWAVQRLTAARNYWFSTTRSDGRPHVMPAWAVWIDDALYFDGSPETRRMRNLVANPALAVHLESGDDVVIVEGQSREVGRPEGAFAERLAAAFAAKYGPTHDYKPSPDQWNEGGLWVLRPRVAFGWDNFPKTITRWRLRAT